MKIKYIIGGAFASGTSFLSSYLSKSKKLNLIKNDNNNEINFFHFTNKYKKGNLWLSSYLDKNKINIDHSSLTLTSQKAPQRIFKYNKNMKFIFCLRNPIDRSYAHYRYTLLNGLENKPFNISIELEEKRKKKLKGKWKEISPYAYIYNGLYFKHLSKFYKLFPHKNILIIKSEDLKSKPYETLKIIFKFMNINFEKYKLPSDFSSGNVINLKKHVKMKKKIGSEFNMLIEKYRANKNCPKKLSHDFNSLKSNLSRDYKQISKKLRIYLSKFFENDLKKLEKFTNIKFYNE